VYKERESLITLVRGVTPISNIHDMFSKRGSINRTESGGKLAPRKITFIFALLVSSATGLFPHHHGMSARFYNSV